MSEDIITLYCTLLMQLSVDNYADIVVMLVRLFTGAQWTSQLSPLGYRCMDFWMRKMCTKRYLDRSPTHVCVNSINGFSMTPIYLCLI